MKKHYFLLICCLCGWLSNAQTIVFADPEFKQLLLEGSCYDSSFSTIDVDANNDNEIQISEAEVVFGIYIGDGYAISSLGGIENFAGLNELYLNYAGDLSSIDISMLSNMKLLSVQYSGISSLNYNPGIRRIVVNFSQLMSFDTSALAGNEDLTTLDLSYNAMTSINLSGLATCPNLATLNLRNNQLGAVDWSSLAGNTNITEINLQSNQITAFDFTQVNNAVTRILLENNQLASVNFVGLDQPLEALHVQDNPYEYFDTAGLSHIDTLYAGGDQLHDAKFTTYDFEYTYLAGENINSIDFKNGINESCFTISHTCALFGIGPRFGTFRNPNQIICTDDYPAIGEGPSFMDKSERAYWSLIINGEDDQALDPLTGPQISPFCSETPGGNYNSVVGNVKYDCGGANLNLQQVPILATEAWSSATTTDASGNYRVHTSSMNISVAPDLEHPAYFTVTPASHAFSFSSSGNSETADFCLSANGVHHDLEIALYPVTDARPGFNATYLMVCKNNGNQTASGSVTLNFDDAVMDFVSASQAVNTQTTNALSWNFTNLTPLETRNVQVTMNINTPTETPAVNIGDQLTFTAQIAGTQTDETPADNQAAINQEVVGSYDPNDKQVSEGAQVSINNAGDYLHYIVRFQNTGTAAAENVVIEDLLEDDLDPSTLRVVAASHPYRATLKYLNQLEVFFTGINLPASIDNEPASHGFVAFKVKPKNWVTLGSEITNKANIYFDYNYPIQTNETSTTFALLSTNGFASANDIAVYPNPAQNVLNIKNTRAENIQSIQIHNVLGQLIYGKNVNERELSVDVSSFETGKYFIRIETQSATSTQHFAKQ